MLSILNHFNKLLLLKTSLTLNTPIRQNTLQLLDSQLVQILRLHLFSLYRELDGTNFRIGRIDSLAYFFGGHAEGEGVGYVAFDGVDVVADFAFAGSEIGSFAVFSEGGFDFGFVFGIGFGNVCLYGFNYFDAYCEILGLGVLGVRLVCLNGLVMDAAVWVLEYNDIKSRGNDSFLKTGKTHLHILQPWQEKP